MGVGEPSRAERLTFCCPAIFDRYGRLPNGGPLPGELGLLPCANPQVRRQQVAELLLYDFQLPNHGILWPSYSVSTGSFDACTPDLLMHRNIRQGAEYRVGNRISCGRNRNIRQGQNIGLATEYLGVEIEIFGRGRISGWQQNIWG